MTLDLAIFIFFLLFKASSPSCVSHSDCDVSNPVCLFQSGSGTCVECSANSDCSTSTNYCHANVCAQCSNNGQCPVSTPICISSRCVECQSSSQCTTDPSKPFCQMNACVQCLDDTPCLGSTPRCLSGSCVECKFPSDCTDPSKPLCSTNHVCVQCTSNTQCPNRNAPVCSSISNTCTACTSTPDCAMFPLYPYCMGGACSQCSLNSHCSSPTPFCSSVGTCVECLMDTQCEQNSPSAPICLTPTQICVQCLVNSDCLDPTQSSCNAFQHICESCAGPSDCSHLPTTPFCSSSGVCVHCLYDTDCPDPAKKCDPNSFTCVNRVACILNVALKETIDNGYKLSVGLSHEACVDPAVTSIFLAVQGLTQNVDFSYKSRKINSQNYEVTLIALKSMDISQLLISVTYNAELSANIELDPIIFLSETEQKIASGIGSTSTGNLAILGISTFAFALLGKLSTTWSFVAISQYISFLLYLNVGYPQQTKTYFRSLKGYGMLLPWKSNKDDDNVSELMNYRNSMPQRFYEEEYPVEFLHNTLQIFALIFGSLFLLGILKILVINDKLKPLFLRKLLVGLRWNVIIRKVCTYALPLSVAACLQMHIAIFRNETSIVANIVAVLSMLGLILAIAKMTISISRIPNQRSKKIFYVGKYGTLWNGLNVQYNFGMYYNVIVTLRGVLLGYLVVFQEVFGLLQLIPLMLYQVFVLTVFYRDLQRQLVFSDKDLNAFCAVQESLLFMLKLLIFLYYFMSDLMKVTDVKALSGFGWVIIFPAFSVQLLQSLYSFYLMYRERKVLCLKLQKIGRKIFCMKPKWTKRIERARKSTSTMSSIQGSESPELSYATSSL